VPSLARPAHRRPVAGRAFVRVRARVQKSKCDVPVVSVEYGTAKFHMPAYIHAFRILSDSFLSETTKVTCACSFWTPAITIVAKHVLLLVPFKHRGNCMRGLVFELNVKKRPLLQTL
jgi:hypothetical protein